MAMDINDFSVAVQWLPLAQALLQVPLLAITTAAATPFDVTQ